MYNLIEVKLMIAFIAISLCLFSCKGTSDNEPKIENIEIDKLLQGPIVNKTLDSVQLSNIKYIHATFNEVYPLSLEETVTNFKRDRNPNKEINIWLNMAKSFQLFAENNVGEEKLEHRKEAFKIILMRSMMPREKVIEKLESEYLDEIEIQKILDSYSLNNVPIKVVKN